MSFSELSPSHFGSLMSALSFIYLRSFLSLREIARLGLSLAVFSCFRFGQTAPLLDFVRLSSSLSLREFSRLGLLFAVFSSFRLVRHYQYQLLISFVWVIRIRLYENSRDLDRYCLSLALLVLDRQPRCLSLCSWVRSCRYKNLRDIELVIDDL